MGCCCGNAAWKREEVPDHKFDFIDVRDYHTEGAWTKTQYAFLFALVVKSFAVYIADIYTAVTLLALNHFNGNIYNKVQNSPDNTVPVPITYSKWVFFGCIVFSFLLLAYEAHKCRAIVRSRDISYAYTNVMANNYYSLRSYDHFCLFSQINNSTKKKDEIAFFIFFTFKGWKRLIVADGPRQVINALTLFGLLEVNKFSTNVYDYYGGSIFTAIMLLTMIFTVVIFAGSAILLLIASLMYLPLLCYIKGNLKEYCCHKIDKRITELVHIKKKQRVAKQAAIARAEAKGDFKHLMNKKGIIVGQKMLQPTLPKVDVDLFSDAAYDEKAKAAAGITSSPSFAPARYAGGATPYGQGYGEDYGSQAHLVLNQGHAGEGSVIGHSVHGSTSDVFHPSVPPSVHNSPDAYPLHIRGNGMHTSTSAAGATLLAASGSQQNHLMSQLGPIGTSPQLFAHRVAGKGTSSAASAQQNDPTLNPFNADATRSTLRNGGTTAAMSSDGIGRSRSPLAPSDSNTYHGGSYDDQQQQQDWGASGVAVGSYDNQAYQAYDDQNGYSSYDPRYEHDYSQHQQPAAAQDAKAYTGDLSAYAPYEEVGQVYDAYYAHDPNDMRGDGYEPHHDQQQGDYYGNGHIGQEQYHTDSYGYGDQYGGGHGPYQQQPSDPYNHQQDADAAAYPPQQQQYQQHQQPQHVQQDYYSASHPGEVYQDRAHSSQRHY